MSFASDASVADSSCRNGSDFPPRLLHERTAEMHLKGGERAGGVGKGRFEMAYCLHDRIGRTARRRLGTLQQQSPDGRLCTDESSPDSVGCRAAEIRRREFPQCLENGTARTYMVKQAPEPVRADGDTLEDDGAVN